VELVDQAVLVDVDEIASLNLVITDTSLEDKRGIGGIRSPYLAGIAEVLNDLVDRAEQCLNLRATLMGRMGHRAVEGDVIGEKGHQRI
jgi:hypothetical protein